VELHHCPYCKAQIAREVPTCPNCGYPDRMQMAVHDPDKTGPPPRPEPPEPVPPPIKIYWGRAALYGGFLALSLWLILSFIPSHDPGGVRKITDLELEVKGQRVELSGTALWDETTISLLYIIAFFIGAFAIFDLLTKTVRGPGRVLPCQSCGRRVVARRRRLWGWRCGECGDRL
jgi:hypothetical protein